MLQFRGKIILGAKLYFCQPLFSKFRCPTSNRFTLKHKYFASVSKDFNYTRCEKAVFDFEINFWFLHEHFQLPMTLKIHVIIDHYNWYFKEMGKNFHDTNGEYVEAVHYSLDGHEESRKYKVKRNLGSDEHLKRALKSHISFNSMKVGSPKRIMTLKRNSPQSSPLSNRK